MNENRHLQLLAEEKVPGALLKLGLPTMVGMMVSYLYNLVDTFFVGILGTSQQAAVSAVFPLSLIMLGIGLLFGTGAGSYLSRLLGEHKQKEADQCASTALITAVIVGGITVVVMLAAIDPILKTLGCTQTMMPYARAYGIPFVIALLFNVFNAVMSNIATSEGASVFSMRSMLAGGISNMILDPVFILLLHMGVTGAAAATLIARLISFSTYVAYILKKRSCLDFSVKNFRPDKKVYGQIMKIGVPTMIYQFLCSTALAFMNFFAAAYGDAAVASIGIVTRICTLGVMTEMGFLKGYQPFVGYNFGAKRIRRVKEATKTALIWTTVFSTLLFLIMVILRYQLVGIFSDDPQVIKIGAEALLIGSISFPTMGFQLVWATRFIGLGKAKEGGLISLGRQGFFFIPVIFIFSRTFGLTGIICAQPCADMLSFVMVCVLAAGSRQTENRLIRAADVI